MIVFTCEDCGELHIRKRSGFREEKRVCKTCWRKAYNSKIYQERKDLESGSKKHVKKLSARK
jgi:hypothetical protein